MGVDTNDRNQRLAVQRISLTSGSPYVGKALPFLEFNGLEGSVRHVDHGPVDKFTALVRAETQELCGNDVRRGAFRVARSEC